MLNAENFEEKSYSQAPTFLVHNDLASNSIRPKHPHVEYENVRLTISGNNVIRVSKGETLRVDIIKALVRMFAHQLSWNRILDQHVHPRLIALNSSLTLFNCSLNFAVAILPGSDRSRS